MTEPPGREASRLRPVRDAAGADAQSACRYSPAEELANCATHGCGTVLAAAGCAALVVKAAAHGTAVHVVSAVVYGGTLLATYASSTLYHAIRNPAAKQALRRVDHASIVLLIAGTYTPFTLVSLGGTLGRSIFGIVWALALFGLFFEDALRRRSVGYSLGLYLLMGWVAIAAVKPLLAALSSGGFALLAAGGLAYSLGTLFYLSRRIPYQHAWWHLAVLCGSGLHFCAVFFHVLPGG